MVDGGKSFYHTRKCKDLMQSVVGDGRSVVGDGRSVVGLTDAQWWVTVAVVGDCGSGG